MAMSQHHRNAQLPPSPPPSPPAARKRHRKKRSDPFLELDSPTIHHTPSPPSSPTKQPDGVQENILIRLIWTPLLFISFLLSLFLVNLSDRARRSSNSTTSTRASSLLAKLNPEPYQDGTDATWGHRDSANHAEPQPKRQRSWHLHKKIRQVARLEISDALEMRSRVLVALVAALLGTGYGTWVVGSWVWGRVWQ